VDMNIAYTAGGKFVEIQGSAENGEGFGHPQLLELVELATSGCRQIAQEQASALVEVKNAPGEVR
jgi:ribonuclease PH